MGHARTVDVQRTQDKKIAGRILPLRPAYIKGSAPY